MDTITISLSQEEARQLKAILSIVARKATRGPFWANFLGTVRAIVGRLP